MSQAPQGVGKCLLWLHTSWLMQNMLSSPHPSLRSFLINFDSPSQGRVNRTNEGSPRQLGDDLNILSGSGGFEPAWSTTQRTRSPNRTDHLSKSFQKNARGKVSCAYVGKPISGGEVMEKASYRSMVKKVGRLKGKHIGRGEGTYTQ